MSLELDGVWKAGVWGTTVWAAGVWREGAPAAEEVAEVAEAALARLPTDFVISPPYYMHEIQAYRGSLGLAKSANDAEEPEVLELVGLYFREIVEMTNIFMVFSNAQGLRP